VLIDENCPLIVKKRTDIALRNGDLLLCFQWVELSGDVLSIGTSLAPSWRDHWCTYATIFSSDRN
jgi:hypothetical protein